MSSVARRSKRLKAVTQTTSQMWHEANRMKRLPLYLFTVLDDLKAQAKRRGVDVMDLGMGNPDLPPPKHVVDELRSQLRFTDNHRYSKPDGRAEIKLKETIAAWYHKKFNVTLDPKTEVLPLIGSKEGIAHLSLAFLNNDDIALVPNPAYPVHFNGVIMAGGILYSVPLTQENNFLPQLHTLSREVVRMAKMLFLSYPHNPTTQVVNIDFLRDAVEWAKQRKIMLIHDFAYSDIVFDGYKAPSVLQVKGATEGAIEFHTMSKSYCMPGWRIGFVVGNREILAALAKAKSYIDFGIFRAVQWATIEALSGPQDYVTKLVNTYHHRRDVFVDGLNRIGWHVPKPKATFYVWAKIPPKFSALTSLEFATLLVQEAGIVAAPGSGFGEYGEGYVRFALVDDAKRLQTAVERIDRVLRMQP